MKKDLHPATSQPSIECRTCKRLRCQVPQSFKFLVQQRKLPGMVVTIPAPTSAIIECGLSFSRSQLDIQEFSPLTAITKSATNIEEAWKSIQTQLEH